MTRWHLGIDFGTSYTVASAAVGDSVTVIDVESSGRARISSAVFLTPDGDILIGSAAEHQAVFAPERFEPTPKRSIGEGEVFLGDRLVPVADLVAAVLRRVYTEACRQQGERAPDGVGVTHPADWGEVRLAVLREAVAKAGMPQVSFIAEPVAAAVRIATEATQPGQRVAVYDFGGGTFDAAVLVRTETGFTVAGPPAGRDPLGGEDIDDRIIAYLGKVLADEDPDAWQALCKPTDVSWRRDAAAFRAEVQRAKETLSETSACQLWVPGIGREVQLTRAELDKLIGPTVDDTVATLEVAIKDAGVVAKSLAGLYLVGGSSRIPLVAESIWRKLAVRPSVQDNPKSVVALGAAAWVASGSPAGGTVAGAAVASGVGPEVAVASRAARKGAAPIAVPDRPGRAPALLSLRTSLAMSYELPAWPAGSDCAAYLTVDQRGSPPLTLRARDEPTPARDAEALSRMVLATRAPRTPGFREVWCGPAWVLGLAGFERRFLMRLGSEVIPMVEQYAVVDERALVVACPEGGRPLLQGLTFKPPDLPPDAWFAPRFGGAATPECRVTEQVVLQRRGTAQSVISVRRSSADGVGVDGWRSEELASALQQPNAGVVGRVPGRVFNQLEGEIATVHSSDRGAYALTKVGMTVLGGEGLAVTITLPYDEQALFPALARHAWLHPNVGTPA